MARVLAAAPVSKGGCGARTGEEHCHRAGVECLPRGVVRTPLALWLTVSLPLLEVYSPSGGREGGHSPPLGASGYPTRRGGRPPPNSCHRHHRQLGGLPQRRGQATWNHLYPLHSAFVRQKSKPQINTGGQRQYVGLASLLPQAWSTALNHQRSLTCVYAVSQRDFLSLCPLGRGH